jgi:hypothetical protein
VGYFFAESLILAETGQSVGAIQIAGQADPTQLPFFVVTCDYTLIGEELYAASAYLSREPVLLGSIRGQDIYKALCIVVGLAGIMVAQYTWKVAYEAVVTPLTYAAVRWIKDREQVDVLDTAITYNPFSLEA